MLSTVADFRKFLSTFNDETQVRLYIEIEQSLFTSNMSISHGTIVAGPADKIPFITVCIPDTAVNYIHDNM